MNKWASSCFPGVLRSWQASSCSQRAVVEHMRTCWADDSAALFPEVPVGDEAGMPVSHQGYFGKAQCKSVLGSRSGFEHKDLLPCFYFQVYLSFEFAFYICSSWPLPSSRVRILTH